MMIKILLTLIFLAILVSLGSALYHLVKQKDGASSPKLVKALSFRIGISVLLFVLLFIFVVTGTITPHGIGSRINSQKSALGETQK
jgi:RsiW-degrading membrane proteinase PrsW (M82 family)